MTKIKVYTGKFDTTTTVSNNLTENQMAQPAVREIMEFAETRMVSTLIVSGVGSEYEAQTKKTKIGQVPEGKLIGSAGYRYRIMGRIQRKSTIIAQVGSSQPDGSFTLRLRDNLLYKGMVVRFYTGLHAIVTAGPVGAAGNYQYTFKTVDGTVFVYATHVATQPGEKTCMGGHTAYGEGSLRGYGRSFFPDEYINHLTIQRKTGEITGDAMSDVTIVEFQGKKGWYFTKERQNKVQFMMENEYQKWFGQSSMRDSLGNLLSQSLLGDDETGNPIIMGDGVVEQIRGANDMAPSGSDGMPTIDDFKDMMTQLKRNSNADSGNVWYVVTGTDGYNHAQDVLRDYLVTNMGGRSNYNQGGDVEVGANFDTFMWAGNKIIFVCHPMFDNDQLFTTLAADGKSTMSGSYIWLNNGFKDGARNVEILAKGANGVNRSMISNYVNGLTGWSEKVQQGSVDSLQHNMLKQDGIFVYNTASCGLMMKAAA